MQNNILIIFLTIQDIIKKIIPLLNALFIVSYSHSHQSNSNGNSNLFYVIMQNYFFFEKKKKILKK